MSVIAANMRFDEKISFAEVIAQLTDLRPLQDLSMPFPRLVPRLEKGDTHNYMDAARFHFLNSKTFFLNACCTLAKTLGAEPDPLTPERMSPERSCSGSFATVSEKRVQNQASSLGDIEAILSGTASLLKPERSQTLLGQLAVARKQLTGVALKGLTLLRIIQQTEEISDADRIAIISKLEEITQRAVDHGKRQNDDQVARLRLYTMVAQWHRWLSVDDCPVGGSDLFRLPPDALLDSDFAGPPPAGLQAHRVARASHLVAVLELPP